MAQAISTDSEPLAAAAPAPGSARRPDRAVVMGLCLAWSVFQLALPRFVTFDSIITRAVHLAFALALVFLTIRPFKGRRRTAGSCRTIGVVDYTLAAVSAAAALYLVIDWVGISARAGLPNARDYVVGVILVMLLLEAARRVVGPALPIIAVAFTVYAFLGPYMPEALAFRGVSLRKYLSQIALSTEGIYGIPLDVSANTVFLFVLMGSILERVGAGRFFNEMALSLLGRFKGGPAKAAIVSSGLTGMASGSSIANVVTTGTFTIPLMKKAGYPPATAAATEVAASTNGQLMPPIMGAAAFIIAEYVGISYIAVVKAALVPALVSYVALFYIAHLEAGKLNMQPLPKEDIPAFVGVLARGFHFLLPIGVLLYELVIKRHSPKLAAFNAIVVLVAVVLTRDMLAARRRGISVPRAAAAGIVSVADGMVAGARNMLAVALATATAGIVVGVVAMGIGSMVVEIVETAAAGNIFLLLFITAAASLVLGMGLPTTANYVVMASVTVPVIVHLSARFEGPPIAPIAAHLFCFYFGILADDTPPVGLAAYAAAAIAGSNPIRTGLKGFSYDLRTAVIPFMFVFNAELLLNGVHSFAQGLLVFLMAAAGACAFASAVQGWCLVRNRWYEIPLFLAAAFILFCPAALTRLLDLDPAGRYFMYLPGLALYGLPILLQRFRVRTAGAARRSSRIRT